MRKFIRQLSLLVILLIPITYGCSFWNKKTLNNSATIKFLNPTDLSMTAIVDATDADERAVLHQAYIVPPATKKKNADGAEIIEKGELEKTFTLERKSKIKMTYIPEGSKAVFTAAQVIVPDSDYPLVEQRELTNVRQYDEAYSVEQLKQLAQQIGAYDFNKQKLVDVIPFLGRIFISTPNEKAEPTVHDTIELAKVSLEHREPDIIRNSIVTQGKVTADLSLSVPIYGSLARNMETNSFYNLVWEVKHYPYTNSFMPSKELNTAEQSDLESLLMSLENNSHASAYFIYSMHVIPSAVFSMAKGQGLSGEINTAIASVFTSSGGYSFNQSDERYSTLSDDVLKITYRKVAEREKLIKWLQAKLKKPSAPPEPALLPKDGISSDLRFINKIEVVKLPQKNH